MLVDPKLQAIARAAEAGQPCPQLRLVSGSTFIVGTPVRSGEFAAATEEALENELWAHAARTLRQKQAEDSYRAARERLLPAVDAAARAPEPEDPPALTLANALVWGWGESSGQRVQVVRVALAGVTSWWIGQSDEVKGQNGRAWFFGTTFPLEG